MIFYVKVEQKKNVVEAALELLESFKLLIREKMSLIIHRFLKKFRTPKLTAIEKYVFTKL